MAEAPTKVDKIKESQKAWKAGVSALAKHKFITADEKVNMIAKYDGQFKELIAAEKAKLKAKAKKKK
jgi:hypothetical protein